MRVTAERLGWPIYLLLALIVVSMVATVGCFVQAHRAGQMDALRLQAAQSQQWIAERILLAASLRGRGGELSELVARFEQLLSVTAADEVSGQWRSFRALLPGQTALASDGDGRIDDVPDLMPLVELTKALSGLLARVEATAAQRESAGHLFQLAQSVADKLVSSDGGSVQPLRARGPWLVFEQILNRFEIMVDSRAITDGDAAGLIEEIRTEYTELNRLFSGSLAELNIRNGAQRQQELEAVHSSLSNTLGNVVTALTLSLQQRNNWFRSGLLLALVPVVLCCLLAGLLWRESRQRATRAERRYRRDQESILRLLNEISALADGDLNTRATVTEDLTGAIADCINYAVSELRRLVGAITSSADRVTVVVDETGASAQQLARASVVQSREIQRSATYLTAMADTMTQMSQRSREASSIASQSVETALRGRQAVQRGVDGMERIHAQIQQTSSLLKRLGESSQQIGEIVRLINQVSGRTRLLALNSVIQTNAADEHKHRFARIADEVQGLSASLKDAAHDIEVLVRIIQDDARAAVVSMDMTTTEVNKGTQLGQQAGNALRDIEAISRRLSVVVEHLSQKTRRQSEVVSQLSANMGVINEVTRKSAHGMQLSAAALEDLRRMAGELRDGVQDFVLPTPRSDRRADEGIVSRPLLRKRNQPARGAPDATTVTERDHG